MPVFVVLRISIDFVLALEIQKHPPTLNNFIAASKAGTLIHLRKCDIITYISHLKSSKSRDYSISLFYKYLLKYSFKLLRK